VRSERRNAETDAPNPLNAYGRTKLAGEQAIHASGCRHLIFRTSWVYSASGKNFVLTILRLAREGRPLRVVDDQHGAPTSNLMLAAALPSAIEQVATGAGAGGVYHMTASGQTTWHGFARAILAATGVAANLSAISSSEYRAAARRPRNSVLDNGKLARQLGLRLPSWQQGLDAVVSAGVA
jgi:dTDP-4-dehydrorhamnose reductase